MWWKSLLHNSCIIVVNSHPHCIIQNIYPNLSYQISWNPLIQTSISVLKYFVDFKTEQQPFLGACLRNFEFINGTIYIYIMIYGSVTIDKALNCVFYPGDIVIIIKNMPPPKSQTNPKPNIYIYVNIFLTRGQQCMLQFYTIETNRISNTL